MNVKTCAAVMLILFSIAFARSESSSQAQEKINRKPLPDGQIGFITISPLARYGALEHRSALALLYYGKHKQGEAELRKILENEPESKDAYVGLVQVSVRFREQEWKRLKSSSSTNRLLQFQKAVLLHYRAMAISPLPAFGVARAPEEILKQRKDASGILQRLWSEQKETIVGAVLLEVKDFLNDSEREAMALDLIRHLAGKEAWEEYQQAKGRGWSSPLPRTPRKSAESLRALSSAIADRWSFLQRKYRKPTAADLKEVAYLDRWMSSINRALGD